MFKPHELIQAGSADVPLPPDASEEHKSAGDDVRRSEVKFARVWQPTDLFGSKAPVGGFVSQSGSAISVKRFALQDVDSLFLIGPRSDAAASTEGSREVPEGDASEPQSDDPGDDQEDQENSVDELAVSHSQQAVDEARAQGYADGMEDASAQLYEQIRAEVRAEKLVSSEAQTLVDQA